MIKRYRVTLTPEEIEICEGRLRRGKHGAQERKRAHALLLANNPENTDAFVAQTVGMHRRTVEELRQRFVEDGFELALKGKPRGHRPRAIQGEDEARLIALACEKAPEGKKRWSLRILAERWATLENTDTKNVSYEAIRKALKKTSSNLGSGRNGVSRRKRRPISRLPWRTCSAYTSVLWIPNAPWSAWTNVRGN